MICYANTPNRPCSGRCVVFHRIESLTSLSCYTRCYSPYQVARYHIESTKQAPRLTEVEGGRLPSADTKIRTQAERKKREVEQGRRKERWRPVERRKGWPAWPALSLEHVAADEEKIKGKKGTPRERPGPRRSSFEEPGALYL